MLGAPNLSASRAGRSRLAVSSKITLFTRALTAGSCLLLPLSGGPAVAQSAPAGNSADAPVQLPAVDVTDSAGPDVGGREDSAANGYRASSTAMTPFGRTSLQDTPYSILSTSGELIENSNAHSLVDAIRSNPTASMLMSSGGYSSMTRLMVRGFSAADQGEMRDGLVDRSFSYPPVENVERIEVLNGFSSFFQGFSSPGGSVNYVSKAPTPTTEASVRVGEYGGGINFVHGDVGGPVPGTDDRLGYRLNAYKEDGETYIDDSRQKRALLSTAFVVRPVDGTTVTADLWHQDYDARGLQTYFANTTAGNWDATKFGVPSASAFSASQQYGQSWTYNKAEKTLGGLRIESELSDAVTLRAGYRHGDMWRQYDYIGAVLVSDGLYQAKETASPRQHERTDSTYELIDLHATLWGIRHNVTAGYDGTYFNYSRGSDVTKVLGNSSVASPAAFADPQLALGPVNSWQNTRYNNTLIGDRVVFDQSWSAVLGINHADLDQKSWSPTTVTAKYTQSANTPTYALLYKPADGVVTYASYMEQLIAGGTAPSTAANANQMLSPSVSSQYEVGIKTTIGAIDVNAALFRIDRVNEETDPADNVYKQDGREIHQGLEVTAIGKLTDRLTAIGGFTLMQAHVQTATADPLSENKIPANVPEREASAYLEYALPFIPDLIVTGGANYYGRRPTDAHDTGYLEGATIFNAGLRYEPEIYGHRTSFDLTVSNLFDTAYWAYFRSGDGLLLGAPRVVALSVKASW